MISPEIVALEIEERKELLEEKKVKLEEKKEEIIERRWKSFCFDLHPQSSIFFAKLIISVMTISLCSYQLITEVDCSSRSLFSSILSSVITFWLSNNKHSD